MNLNNVSLIKIGNGSEVSFMKLGNGPIVYQKDAIPLHKHYEFFYNETITEVKTRIDSTHETLNSMFIQCSNLQTVNISGWDKNNGRVTDMYMMFYNCYSLTTINTIDFNTNGVKDMGSMFSSCRKLESLDLSGFNTTNVTNMSDMFYGCELLVSLDLSNFNMDKVTNTSHMFMNCNLLLELKLNNCSKNTIEKIIKSTNFPTEDVSGMKRELWCKQENAPDESLLPSGWEIIPVD